MAGLKSRKAKKDYHTMPIRIPSEVKKRVRFIAAERETSLSDAAMELVILGLKAYEADTGRG